MTNDKIQELIREALANDREYVKAYVDKNLVPHPQVMAERIVHWIKAHDQHYHEHVLS